MATPKKLSAEAELKQTNFGQINEDLKMRMNEIASMEDKRTVINNNIRKMVADIKTVFGFPATTTRYILKMNRMDKEARSQFESSTVDMNRALGYQQSLELVNDSRLDSAKIGKPDPMAKAAAMAAAH